MDRPLIIYITVSVMCLIITVGTGSGTATVRPVDMLDITYDQFSFEVFRGRTVDIELRCFLSIYYVSIYRSVTVLKSTPRVDFSLDIPGGRYLHHYAALVM